MMKRFLATYAWIIAAVLCIVAYGVYANSEKPAGFTHQGDTKGSRQIAPSLSGKVLETMDSGGYTYVKIDTEGKNVWVAVPKMKVEVGQDVSFTPGMEMSNFTSKTLNRTFESIIFSTGVVGGHATPAQQSSANKPAGPKADEVIKVDKASGPNAYTVAELYEKRAELDTKSVTVRGKVVKVSTAIMGKNWVHIQDGSGDQSKGTHDILVTSQDLPSVGDIVTAKGTLYKDKDFGSGYKYSVMLEETNIEK
jgi:hypothetical protein